MSNFKVILNNAGMLIRHYAPEIMTVTGVISMTAGAVIACKETPAALEIMEGHKEEMRVIKECHEKALANGGKVENTKGELVPYSEDQYKKDVIQSRVNCGKNVAKKYSLGAGLFAAGTAMVFGGQGLLRKDYTTVVVGASALAERFGTYRDRVIEDLGDAADKKFLYGVKTEETQEEVTDQETGEVTTEVKVKQTFGKDEIPDNDPNYFLFAARTCGDQYTGNPLIDLNRVKVIQNTCQDRVDQFGNCTNNYIREQFGLHGCDRGLFTGIVKTGTVSHGKVDFGIFDDCGNPKSWVFEAIERYNGIPIEIRDDGSIIGQLKNPRNARA